MKKLIILTMVIALVGVNQAAWTVLDNFEAYENSDTHTTIATGGVWTSVFDGTNNSHVIDSDVEHGQVLQTTGGAAWRGAERDLTGTAAVVPVDGVMTYFWQVRPYYTSDGGGWDYDFMMGLAPSVDNIDDVDAWRDFNVMPFINNEALSPYINADGAGTFWAPMTPDTWYNVWVVVTNDAADPTYACYYSEVGSETPILVHADAYWRNTGEPDMGINQDLNAIGFMAAGNVGTFFDIDNICYTVGEDLTIPSTFSYSIGYDSPVNGADLIPVERTSPENDLVFTVFDPNIVIADVYFSADDPNTPDLLVDDLAIGPDGHGEITKTITLETELVSDLSFDTDYYWRVIGYEPNYLDPGNYLPIDAGVSMFTTAPEEPIYVTQPAAYTLADAAGDATLSVVAANTNFYKWYHEDDPGTTLSATDTLTITGAVKADEGNYYCEISSIGFPDPVVSNPARLVTRRQMSYYDFEEISELPDGNDVFLDSIDGYHAVLSQEAASAGLPTLNDANAIVGTYCVEFDNADHDTDPNGNFLQIYPGVVDYEDITIALWAHPLGGNEWQRLWSFGADTDNRMFLTADAGGGPGLRFDINGQQLNSDWLPSGSWYHVVVTLSGDTGKMYVNGEWVATDPTPPNPVDLNAVLNYIGKSQYAADQEFNGFIDDLKIWSYGLTNEQVAQEYMAITGDDYVCDTENNDLWRYDQGWFFDPEDPSSWIGGNNNCKLDLPDFAGLARRWLESNQFVAP